MSSFVKLRGPKSVIPGVKVSSYNGQSIASTGNLALDSILGGGQELKSILMIGKKLFP